MTEMLSENGPRRLYGSTRPLRQVGRQRLALKLGTNHSSDDLAPSQLSQRFRMETHKIMLQNVMYDTGASDNGRNVD
jgi:hypothetical protein